MRYKVTPQHIFPYEKNGEKDIFEITLKEKRESRNNIIETEEQYLSIREENKEFYDIKSRRYRPTTHSSIYAYDLVYSQKHKNHIPFKHHKRDDLIGQDLSKKLATLVQNGIVTEIIFPPRYSEKIYLAEELIRNEILSLQDIALLGASEENTELTIQIELHPLRMDDFVSLGR